MEENLFDKLREMSGKFPERLSILEEQIDVKLQLEYFKFSKKIKKELKRGETINIDELPDLNNSELLNDEKKLTLSKLASIDDPKAYRLIEDFLKSADATIKDWAILALQESKMLMESSLLDENQIFISTGLGGKGKLLRYFVVLIGEKSEPFAEFQQQVIKSEFGYALKNNKCELENINFQEHFVTLMVLIPFEVPFQNVFKTAVEECNQFGGFLKTNFLVTNVKSLTLSEIKEFVENKELPENKNFDDITFEPIDDDE